MTHKENSSIEGAGKPQQAQSIPPTNSGLESSDLNLLVADSIWNRSFGSWRELFLTRTDFPDRSIETAPHMLGLHQDAINFIKYDNTDEQRQMDLIKLIGSGEIAISIKHHSPSPEENEKIKLQCTHIQIAVGVENGVVTVNNPQNYEGGLFGSQEYPMIFIKPKFPSIVTTEQAKKYVDNIRTWLVIANTFTHFPSDYDGGDPLSCIDKASVLRMGEALIGALNGDAQCKAWLAESKQQIYCAELALLVLNLGLYFPLNEKHLGGNFQGVRSSLEDKKFLLANRNEYIKLIPLTTAQEDLLPFDEVVVPDAGPELFWGGMAVKPFCVADIIEQFIQRVVPRQLLGEQDGSKYQAMAFESVRPSLTNFLRIENSEQRQYLENKLEIISNIVGKAFGSYSEFRQMITPHLKELSAFSLKHGCAYVPPHCFLIRATDNLMGGFNGGVLGWEYLGHGLHRRLFTSEVAND